MVNRRALCDAPKRQLQSSERKKVCDRGIPYASDLKCKYSRVDRFVTRDQMHMSVARQQELVLM